MWVLAYCNVGDYYDFFNAEFFPIEVNTEIRRKHTSVAVKRPDPISLDFGVEEIVFNIKGYLNCTNINYLAAIQNLRTIMQRSIEYSPETSLVSILDATGILHESYDPVSVFPEFEWIKRASYTDANGVSHDLYEVNEYLAPFSISVRREARFPGRWICDLSFRAGLANKTQTVWEASGWTP